MKCRKTPFEGEGLVKIPQDSRYVTVLKPSWKLETVEYIWVTIWCILDWIVGFCHTSLVYSGSTSEE